MKNLLMKTTISVLAVLFATSLLSAGSVKLTFPEASTKTIWILNQMPTSLPDGGQYYSASTVALDIPAGLENGIIFVYDKAKGNVAAKKVAEASKGWTLDQKDWNIAEAILQIELDGKGLESGTAIIEGGGQQTTAAISQGKAKLFNVPTGQIQVTVKYKQGETEVISPTQTLILSLNRTEPVPIRKIVLASSATPTGEPPEKQATSKDQTAPPPQKDEATGMLQMCGSFILWLLVLVGIGALLLLAIRYLKAHQGKVTGGLQALGIQIPDGTDTAGTPVSGPATKGAAPATPVVQPGHCPYCGQPEAQCVCRTTAAGSVAPVSSAAPITFRLVSDTGIVLSIPEGISVIGRESGSAQLIVQDPTVSRIHAEIEKSGARIILRDKGSSNGTFVNGSKIATDTELRSGDVVQFGAVRMRVEA